MKAPISLILLLASSAMLSASDYFGNLDEPYRSDAPNRRFSVQAHQENGYYKFDVKIIELACNKTVLTLPESSVSHPAAARARPTPKTNFRQNE